MLPEPLAPLAAWPHFVAWRLEWNSERSKWDKIPYSPILGRKAASTRPEEWSTYERAQQFSSANDMAGVGFMFSERDPFWFLDIDGAWDGKRWSLVSQEVCSRLPGVAVEVSQSGTGLHLIGSGVAPLNHGNRNIPLKLEFYTKERFVALTGTNATGSVSTMATEALAGVVAQFFERTAGTVGVEWATEADPAWSGPEDDAELLERALRSGKQTAAQAFGSKADEPSFEDLFTANVDILRARWPSETSAGDFNHSSADQSLANRLAFWTGKNCERIERLMRMSGLYRQKWEPETHATYLQNTILKAVGMVQNVYAQQAAREPSPVVPPEPVEPEEIAEAGFSHRAGGTGYMGATGQLEHFKDCVYIMALNKVLTASGDLLDQPRFNVKYGGHEFVLSLDGKKTSSSAWLAFTENQAFEAPVADRLCFRPEFGEQRIVIDGGKRLANAYTPAHTAEVEGDPSVFVDHIQRMLPGGRDAEILLTYMASVKQHPGMKAQWWPVVQGAQGNGKSSLLMIMSYAVGMHYSHLPNTEKMIRNGMNFNGWVERKLFLGLDEIHGSDRRGFFHGFKTTVTNPVLPIEGKGIEEVIGDNRANGIIVLNDQDGVPISDSDRRYAPLFCAQQSKADMLRDGMNDAYFQNFYSWLRGRGAYSDHGADYGYRVINHYLARKELAADVDPYQLAIHAPMTTSTDAAVRSSRGRAEQEIQEAIEEEKPGFAGGWVSSIQLEILLERKKYNVPRNKRKEMMQALGYDYHPALGPDGRVSSVVAPDNGKPRLFCKVGSIAALNLDNPRSVAIAYAEAQLKAGNATGAAAAAFTPK